MEFQGFRLLCSYWLLMDVQTCTAFTFDINSLLKTRLEPTSTLWITSLTT